MTIVQHCPEHSVTDQSSLIRAVAVELGPLMRDATVKFYPAVFLANAMAAFILNLVRASRRPANAQLH